ncbi:hypothetical protein [Rivibacter subsaxonicus]|uniref:Uncharacterized protein n=1 Tax=Rivibacter subsaxonicus TaxID=457575 RepID=A0A4Q7W0X7_9BURK|nr:hypothetical protein [Rivibacter subsaxonicus]RZU02847.1 hypothetical protein EV670_0877 [Rivibacter subsaxonicus]
MSAPAASMESTPLLAIEIVLGFGVPIAWGVWQLIDLRRENRRAAERAAQEKAAAQRTPPPPASD